MGRTIINYCDFCGKRTDKLNHILKLYEGGYSGKTIFTKKLCLRCAKKLMGLEFIGDKIKEDIENHIDKLKIKTHQNLLSIEGTN